MIERNIIPSKGTIYINNKNILDYNLNTLRSNIIYVGQKEALYSDTIKNNILLNKNNIHEFDKVCDICLLENIVSKRPFRYDFGIDNNIANISGGERQRIILARALMNNPKVLILDEALSEVDAKQEKQIIRNLKNNYADITIIYISHKQDYNLFERIINFEEVNRIG